MVAAYLLTKDAMDEKASRYDALVTAALQRQKLSRTMNVLRASEDGKTTREAVLCDFRKASALQDVDNHIMEAIKELLAVAEEKDMTAIEGRFTPQALYAIKELGSVTKMSFQEITWELYPALKPKPPVTGQIFAFPSRPVRTPGEPA